MSCAVVQKIHPSPRRSFITARGYASAVLAVLHTLVLYQNSWTYRITQATPHDSPGTLFFLCQTDK